MSEPINPEQDRMDEVLREAMTTPAPSLSSSFDRTLSRRLRPRRLSPGGRFVLALYVIAAVIFSVWVMRRESIDWVYVAAAVLMPVASVGVYVLRSTVRSERLPSS